MHSKVLLALVAMTFNFAHRGVLDRQAIMAEDDTRVPLTRLAVLLAFGASRMNLVA